MLHRQINMVAGLLVATLVVDGDAATLRPLVELPKTQLGSLIGDARSTPQVKIRLACGGLNEPRCPHPNEQIIEASTPTKQEQVKKAQQAKDAGKKIQATTGLK